MTVQNEVEWLIGIIKSNWPGGSGSFPSNLVRRNRDEPRIYYPDDTTEREFGVSLDRYNAVGLSGGSVQRELYGTAPQYRVQTTVDVRVEGKADEEWGETSDINDFRGLVAYIQYAINSEITYPSVQPGREDIGFVTYLDLRIEDEQNLSVGDKDYYRTDFTVRLRGNAETP